MNKHLTSFRGFLEYWIVIYVFAALWIEQSLVAVSIGSLFLTVFLVLIPFVLLIRILKYQCKYSYLIVFIFLFYILCLIVSHLINDVKLYLDPEAANMFTGCIACEIKIGLKWICFTSLAILLQFGKTISSKIEYSRNELWLAAFMGLVVFLLNYIFTF